MVKQCKLFSFFFFLFKRENVFKRSKYCIFSSKNDELKMKKLLNKGEISELEPLTSNLIIAKRKVPLVFDKAVYVGFSILEISKMHMYNLFYFVLKPKWPLKLMYM